MTIPKFKIDTILVLYIGLGPVFWIGPIGVPYFKIIKFLLFFFALIWVTLEGVNKQDLKVNNTFLVFISLLFLTSIFGFIQTDVSGIVSVSMSYILLFFVFGVFYQYFKDKSFEDILSIFLKATSIIAYLCIFIIINHVLNIVDWKYISKITESYAHMVKLADTGFSTGRTAWSNSLALYFTIAVYGFFRRKNKTLLLYALIIFIAQILSGGRGGLVISITVFLTYVLSRVNFKVLIVLFITGSVLIYSNQEYLKKRLRFNKLERADDNALDKFTAGRLGHFVFAFKSIGEDFNFIKGNGFLKKENKIDKETDIHFLWLKKLLEGGVFYLSIYVLFVVFFIYRLINLYLKDKKYALFLYVFLAGLITTLFEPNAIFGSLQSSLVWWAVIASSESLRISNNV
ncbi:hypothetical protein CLV86_1827 [Lacinutrix venerupis]|uniref:hypothetical protein n=1 Tax=Lacinutrix venerupis TaxID=1486034 RepID=UPI000EAE46BF|nr:hypothetical protein [Lacinutrix venerupis]RLJ63290.1 hypothetical protein CLV86_1827 [Lacinutrix venerupis]